MKKILYTALALTMLVGCNKEIDFGGENGDNAVKFTSEIAATRASGTTWANNDAVGIYMLDNTTKTELNSNVKYTTTSGGVFSVASGVTPIYYPVSGNVDFVAYYPYQTPLTSNIYVVNVATQVNGDGTSNLPAIDLMRSRLNNQSKNRAGHNFVFTHCLSNVVLTIASGKGVTNADLAGLKITLKDINTTAPFDVLAGTIGTQADSKDVMFLTATNGLSSEAILLPGDISGKVMEFEITTGALTGLKFESTFPTTTLAATMKHTYNVTIDREAVKFSGVTISPWGNGGSSDLNAGEVMPKPGAFELEITTAANGDEMTLPFPQSGNTGAYELTIDWGEGSAPQVVSAGTAMNAALWSHTYATAGVYKISISSSEKDYATKAQMPAWGFFDTSFNPFGTPDFLTKVLTPMLRVEGTSLMAAFGACQNLTEIPTGLFDRNTQVTSFMLAFAYCSNLQSIPVGLFDRNTQVTGFDGTFMGCNNLQSIPTGLFDKNTQVTSFANTFGGCSSLQSIPTGLFDKNMQVTSFASTFENCINLQSIPAELFDKNTLVTSFASTFGECSNLQSIPAGLFANNLKVTNFRGTFYECTKAKLSSDIFIGGTSTKENRFTGVTSITFEYCFNNVGTALSTGYGTAPDLWDYTYKVDATVNTGDYSICCYSGINANVSNYSQIPTTTTYTQFREVVGVGGKVTTLRWM